MSILKNFTWVFVLAVSLFALSGCESEVVVAPGQHCVNEPVEVCHQWRDWRGFWHHECRTEIRQRCWLAAQSLGNPVGAVGLGNDYSVGFDAAEQLINVAVSANKGNPIPAVQVGLGATDIANLRKQQLPSEDGIEAVAKNLNQDHEAIRGLFSGIISETIQNKK
jgi:hypothetical protein